MAIGKCLRLLIVAFILSFCGISLIAGINVPFAVLLCYSVICYFISFRLKIKRFYILLVLVAIISRIIYIGFVNTPPQSDFELLYNAAVSFSKGDYSFNQYEYFKNWAYQTGFVIYQGTIIKIFGTNNALLTLKIFNAVFSSGTILLIYLITRNFVKENTARFVSMLSAGLLFPLTFVTVLSNQHLSTFLIFLGLFIFLDKKLKLNKILRSVFFGLLIGLSNVIRPEGIIIISAVFFFLMLQLINPGGEKRILLISSFLLSVILYFGTHFLISKVIIAGGVNPQGLRNNNVLWKFVAGFNYESKGQYSRKDEYLVLYKDRTQEECNKFELSLIKERIGMEPKKILALFINKQFVLWGGDPLFWSYEHLKESKPSLRMLGVEFPFDKLSELLRRIHALQMFLLMLFSLIGAAFKIREGYIDTPLIICYLILLATAGIYLLVEVQPRYAYLPQFILIVTSSAGIDGIYNYLAKLKLLKGNNSNKKIIDANTGQ